MNDEFLKYLCSECKDALNGLSSIENAQDNPEGIEIHRAKVKYNKDYSSKIFSILAKYLQTNGTK